MKKRIKKLRLEGQLKLIIMIGMALIVLLKSTDNEYQKYLSFIVGGLLLIYAIVGLLKNVGSRKSFSSISMLADTFIIFSIYKFFIDGSSSVLETNANIYEYAVIAIYAYFVIDALGNIAKIGDYHKKIKYSTRLIVSQVFLIVISILIILLSTGNIEFIIIDSLTKYLNNNTALFILLAYDGFSCFEVNRKIIKAIKSIEKDKKVYDKEIKKEENTIQ